MSEMILTHALAEAAILGGAVLGGGGGGSMGKGRRNAEEALSIGKVKLIDIDDLSAESVLITSSAVGAPAAREAQAVPKDYMRVVEILMENGCPRPGGFIPNECGGSSITNGWVPSALMDIPLVDALCNGRAHPTGVMGSMGLHRDPKYVSYQAAAGGDPEKGTYLELHVAAKLDTAAALIRSAADRAGGLVAVARNPVEVAFVKKNGACGALKQAIELGQKMIAAGQGGGESVMQAVNDYLGGRLVVRGRVSEAELVTKGGFDTGRIVVGEYEAVFWNEFMTLERDDERIATFPDLIMSLNAEDGLPVTTAEIEQGQEIFLIVVPADNLILGEGMRSVDLMETIEPVIGKKIVQYLNMERKDGSCR